MPGRGTIWLTSPWRAISAKNPNRSVASGFMNCPGKRWRGPGGIRSVSDLVRCNLRVVAIIRSSPLPMVHGTTSPRPGGPARKPFQEEGGGTGRGGSRYIHQLGLRPKTFMYRHRSRGGCLPFEEYLDHLGIVDRSVPVELMGIDDEPILIDEEDDTAVCAPGITEAVVDAVG